MRNSQKRLDSLTQDVDPMVSVIVPTSDRPNFLKDALESIRSQTYRNFEVIVVNDGGEDVSNLVGEVLQGMKAVCLANGCRKGPSAARNAALKVAKGRYIAYLDDDDVYYPDHLETLVSYLERPRCADRGFFGGVCQPDHLAL